MSQVYPIHPEAEQVTLPVEFPKSKERYIVRSTQLKTDLNLEPRMKVRLDGEGYISKVALDASGDENEARWTVVIDRCVLEEME